MSIHRRDVLRSSFKGVCIGEIFPTYFPYDVDDRIGEVVGCVYTFTDAWVHMHRYVIRSDQMQCIRVNTKPNNNCGLYSKVNNEGKEVLYLDMLCTQEWSGE